MVAISNGAISCGAHIIDYVRDPDSGLNSKSAFGQNNSATKSVSTFVHCHNIARKVIPYHSNVSPSIISLFAHESTMGHTNV